jgi:hypothetical protein
LQRLHQRFDAVRIEFSFHPTDRNGPVQEFFRVSFPASLPTDRLELTVAFLKYWPKAFYQVIESANG